MRAIIIMFLFSIAILSKGQNQTIIIEPKAPEKAFIYSFVIPGLGQMYNEQVMLGSLIFITEGCLIAKAIQVSGPGYVENANVKYLVAASIIHLVQLIDAPFISDKINRINKNKQYNNKWSVIPSNNGISLLVKF